VSAQGPSGPTRVPLLLLVEPRADEREMYGEYLTWRGFRVALTGDLRDGIIKARRIAPDLVCASIAIADDTAARFCAALHDRRRPRRTPLIILTTLTSDADLTLVRRSGCDTVLIKPCLPEALVTEARRLIAPRSAG
jgi:DNA-binding response OmpR family regulator